MEQLEAQVQNEMSTTDGIQWVCITLGLGAAMFALLCERWDRMEEVEVLRTEVKILKHKLSEVKNVAP